MGRELTAYDGHSVLIGSDSSEGALGDKSLYSGTSVNRRYRGGWSQTRPPFHSLNIIGEDNVLEKLYGDRVVSGAYGFDGARSQPHIILAVDDYLIKLRLSGGDAVATILYEGWGGGLRHTFFAQAEGSVFIQNLRDSPLFWNGNSDLAEEVNSSFLAPDGTFVIPMPIGGPMVYAHSRIFVTDKNNIVWVSDPLYARGLVNPERNLANFSEGTYPVSGGGLTAPGNFGPISGITVIPKHPSVNGHGPVLVLNKKGLWSIDPTVAPRNEWVNRNDLTETVLAGRGCASPHSIVAVNNDIWFRSNDGTISSLKHSITQDRTTWGDKALSREVQNYLVDDAPSLLQYSYAVKGRNRALFTTGITNGLDGSIGASRFGRGIVSIDFDPGSTIRSSHEFAWDGLWTGLNVAALIEIEENSEERVMAISHDNDKKIRIYELKEESKTNDFVDGKEVLIESFYTIDNNFSQLNPESTESVKRLEKIELRYDNAYGASYIGAKFKPSLYPVWTNLLDERQISDHCLSIPDDVPCGSIPKPAHGRERSNDIPKDSFDGRNDESLIESEDFDILIYARGVVRMRKMVISILNGFKSNKNTDSECKDLSRFIFCIDNDDDFYSYKIVK